MLLIVKEFIIVMVLAALTFKYARPLALRFISPADYSCRRTTWFVLTVLVFVAPNFWIFCVAVIPLLIWAGKRDTNPAALFIFLLNVVPPISKRVPMIGISYLINASFYMLLCIFVMLPVASRLLRSKQIARNDGMGLLDFCLIAYCALRAVLFVHPEIAPGVIMSATATDCIRRALELALTLLVPYFVIGRTVTSRKAVLDVLASFCMACALLAVMAVFERARGWLLYNEVTEVLSGGEATHYLMRGGALRAMASAGHPLTLGTLLAIGCGCLLGLQPYIKSFASRLYAMLLFWVGLLAAYSRGPWLGAASIYLSFNAVRPRAVQKIFRLVFIAALVALGLYLSPLGDSIVRVVPFLGGTVDIQNIDYRQQLQDRTWQIIMDSPFFGDSSALLKMQDLRQGQGIIDLVNGYVVVLLDDGFVGLALLLSFVLLGAFKAWTMSRQLRHSDPNFSAVGGSLVASIVGTLLMIESGGSNDVMVCSLVALSAAYACIGLRAPKDSDQPEAAIGDTNVAGPAVLADGVT